MQKRVSVVHMRTESGAESGAEEDKVKITPEKGGCQTGFHPSGNYYEKVINKSVTLRLAVLFKLRTALSELYSGFVCLAVSYDSSIGHRNV